MYDAPVKNYTAVSATLAIKQNSKYTLSWF